MLHQDLENLDALRPKKPKRLLTVLTRDETLRVKDMDFAQHQIVVRDAKGEAMWQETARAIFERLNLLLVAEMEAV